MGKSTPDAQLAVIIISPAHKDAARHYRAGVVIPRGDGGGGDACRVWSKRVHLLTWF
jgi:hypothetical protein